MAPYNPPINSNGYLEVELNGINSEFMFKMIGKNGRNFYDITDYLGIDYLWYDKDRNILELWGNIKSDTRLKMNNIISCYKEIY
jgi:hypothetical protein